MLTFEGVGGVEVDGSLLVDCQMRCSNMRRRRRSVVLGNLSSDHLLALWAKRALLFEEVRFAGCVGALVRRCVGVVAQVDWLAVKRGAICCSDKQCGARLETEGPRVARVKRLAFASSSVWLSVKSTVVDVREVGRRAE
jgi:hypothetical protein